MSDTIERIYKPGNPSPYADPMDYVPMCAPCHRRSDIAKAKG